MSGNSVQKQTPVFPLSLWPPWQVAEVGVRGCWGTGVTQGMAHSPGCWRSRVSLAAMVHQLHECRVHLADRPHGPAAAHLPTENSH